MPQDVDDLMRDALEELLRREQIIADVTAERDRYKAAIDAILAGAPDPVSVCERAVRGRR